MRTKVKRPWLVIVLNHRLDVKVRASCDEIRLIALVPDLEMVDTYGGILWTTAQIRWYGGETRETSGWSPAAEKALPPVRFLCSFSGRPVLAQQAALRRVRRRSRLTTGQWSKPRTVDRQEVDPV
jgi:hypothetical protein